MKKLILTAAIAVTFVFGMTACNNNKKSAEAENECPEQTEMCEHECPHHHHHHPHCTCADTTCAVNHCENCTDTTCAAKCCPPPCCKGKKPECCKEGAECCKEGAECCKPKCCKEGEMKECCKDGKKECCKDGKKECCEKK